jgi:hypothetical protein
LYNNESSSLDAANSAQAAGGATLTPLAPAKFAQQPVRLMSISEALEQAKRNY